MSRTVVEHSGPSRVRILSMLVLTTFFWGGSFLFTKIGVAELAPQWFVFFRFLIATIIMLVVSIPRLHRLTITTIQRGAVVGLALGVTNISFVFGVQGTSISRAGILNNLFVLIIPVVSRLIWKDRLDRLTGLGITLAVVGIGVLASAGGGLNRGDLVSLMCAGFIAVHILTVSHVIGDDDIWLVSLIQFGVVAAVAGISTVISPVPLVQPSSTVISALVYCAVFPTVVCFTLQNTYQRYVSPSQAGLIYTLDPVWSLLAGTLVLGEWLTFREWIGCVLLFLAVLVPLLLRRRRERQVSC